MSAELLVDLTRKDDTCGAQAQLQRIPDMAFSSALCRGVVLGYAIMMLCLRPRCQRRFEWALVMVGYRI